MARLAVFGLVKQRYGGAYLSGCTVAALESIVFDKGGLHRMKFIADGKPLDRGDAFPVAGSRQSQTRQHPPPVDDHRAGTALSLIAPLLCTGQSEGFAEGVKQDRAGINLDAL